MFGSAFATLWIPGETANAAPANNASFFDMPARSF
jgi:hypothetical protein